MLTLLLMRHTKSSWDDPSLEDYARPLKKKGKRRAAEMAKMLEGKWAVPNRGLVLNG